VAAFGPMAGTVTTSIVRSLPRWAKATSQGPGQSRRLASGCVARGYRRHRSVAAAALQPVVDVMRKIGGLMVEGNWGELGRMALGGLTEAFTWAMETVKASWDTWLQAMSDKLYEVIGKVWGWWNEKVQAMTTSLLEKAGLATPANQQQTENDRQRAEEIAKIKIALSRNAVIESGLEKDGNEKLLESYRAGTEELKLRLKGLEAVQRARETGAMGGGSAIGAEGGGIVAPAKADTSVADREAARLRQQAAADAAAKRFADLFGISSTPEGAAGNDAAAAARIKAEKDKLKALTDAFQPIAAEVVNLPQSAAAAGTTPTAGKGFTPEKTIGGMAATLKELGLLRADERIGNKELMARYQSLMTATGGLTAGENSRIIRNTGRIQEQAIRGLDTYSSAAAQAIGFGGAGGGGPAEQTAKGVGEMVTILKELGIMTADQVAGTKEVKAMYERFLAAFQYG